MHVGTSHLVSDLWSKCQELEHALNNPKQDLLLECAEALKPFANLINAVNADCADDANIFFLRRKVLVGELRRAARAISRLQQEKEKT